jgi:CRISPR-associated exonuclease Cas4
MESIQSVTQITDDKSGFSLTASHLLEYLFCPRFTYFEYVLDIPQYEENASRLKLAGRYTKKYAE